MTYKVFLSGPSVVAILVGVTMLAMLVTLVLGAFGEPERSHKVLLFVSLTAIWATAVSVVVLIRLTI
jgi:hypothetical protein